MNNDINTAYILRDAIRQKTIKLFALQEVNNFKLRQVQVAHPEMSSLNARYESFANLNTQPTSPNSLYDPQIIRLARSNFFHNPTTVNPNRITCFIGGEHINNPQSDKDPLEIHKRIKFNCLGISEDVSPLYPQYLNKNDRKITFPTQIQESLAQKDDAFRSSSKSRIFPLQCY